MERTLDRRFHSPLLEVACLKMLRTTMLGG